MFKVMLVDDHACVRGALKSVLEDNDLGVDLEVVAEAGNGREALAQLQAMDGDGCDVLVTDYRMPQMDGVGLTQRVRALRPHLPIVVITATEEGPIWTRVRAVGANAVLDKHAPAEKLVTIVCELAHSTMALRGAAPTTPPTPESGSTDGG